MDSNENQQNVSFVLMHLDPKASHPLVPRSGPIERGEKHYLLVNVVDSRHTKTSAPVTVIELNGSKLDTYNNILADFTEITRRFYRKHGFIDFPSTFTEDRKIELQRAIWHIGHLIYDLFASERNPVRDWLERLLEPSLHRPSQAVTIVTNDFSVPWFWLKRQFRGPSLCEVCSLGMLQLQAKGRSGEAHPRQGVNNGDSYEALLIKGSSNLGFLEEELAAIQTVLWGNVRTKRVKARIARSIDDTNFSQFPKTKLLKDFRVVHFSGHYSGAELLMNESPLQIWSLEPVLHGSLLVLDGCSSARDLAAWTDVEGLTSALINEGGVLGCVVTVLPVKHDPIASKVFWEAFYGDLLSGVNTVGHALVTARIKLRDHFVSIDAENPMWASYQLIGNPAARLFDEHDGDE